MRQRPSLPTALALLALLAVAAPVVAGHFTKEHATLFLNGTVQIRFDALQIGWSKDEKSIDHLRYVLCALKGKIILLNVEYLDRAMNNRELVRWSQATAPLNLELSSRFNRLGNDPRGEVAQRSNLAISPFHLDSAQVRFHILATGRLYKVVWRPKSGEIFATW